MAANEALPEMSAVELRRAIGARQISPVELFEACRERIERLNPGINALAATCFDRARQEARAAEAAVMRGDPLGLLHGLPVGIKDLEETAGLLTTYGSPLYRDYIPERDGSMVGRVRAAGAIIAAKTNTPEFGAGANTRNVVWGVTGNPFNRQLNAGGSSGGSAVALACDLLPLCSGTDTGGSLRIPAAMCGVTGFRPSPGLVGSDRRSLGWAPISVLGPMGRSVADTCMLLAAQAQMDVFDPLSYPLDGATYRTPVPVDLASVRVAWTEDFDVCPVSDEIRGVFRGKVGGMRHLFKACDEITFDFGDAHRSFDVVRALNFVDRFQDIYIRDPEALGPNVRANYETGARMTLADVAWAHAEQTRIFRRFQRTFDDYDLVLSPTVPVSPFPWQQSHLTEMNGEPLLNYYHWLALTYVITLVTNPAISLPCGRDHNDMPFGLQVIGRFREDGALLGAAQAMEHAFNAIPAFRRPRPDVGALSSPAPELKSIVTHPPIGAE